MVSRNAVTSSAKSLPVCQNSKAPDESPTRASYHRIRKGVHVACVVIFIALPFFNVMRFDIPRQRFYFAGYELWINEFGIIFFALMFLLFIVVAASMFYGRVYCGYLCPQMIFSEASIAIENRLRRVVNKRAIRLSPKKRNLIARALFFTVLAAASVFVSFVFISYFVEPRDLLARLATLDVRTAGGIAGAATTLVTFLDFSLVRQRFCTTACPYGYLQGMLSDGDTLIVHYRDEDRDCIECKKCVRVCEMGIDIRTSPYQIECIHCGECIDACADVLGRLGKQTLIHYAWGERGELLGDKTAPWYRRIGMRDAKRVVLLLVLLFYASGLFVALSMRRNVLVRISPDRTTMFRVGSEGLVYNKFRLTIANRGRGDAELVLSIEDLPGSRAVLESTTMPIGAGQTVQREFEIAAAPSGLSPGVNHFRIVGRVTPDETEDQFDMTFITPERKR